MNNCTYLAGLIPLIAFVFIMIIIKYGGIEDDSEGGI